MLGATDLTGDSFNSPLWLPESEVQYLSSSGAGQTFTFVFSDTQNASNLAAMAVLFNTSVTFTNACYIIYDRNAATITTSSISRKNGLCLRRQ